MTQQLQQKTYPLKRALAALLRHKGERQLKVSVEIAQALGAAALAAVLIVVGTTVIVEDWRALEQHYHSLPAG